MDVREKTASEKRLIDYYYLAEKIECPGVPLVYWDDVESAPAVDAVEVVRCRDCKWFAENNCGEWYGCWLFNAILANERDRPMEYDFCSYGERKEDAD